jgi:tetratricopeptide (TPR) repeat protein
VRVRAGLVCALGCAVLLAGAFPRAQASAGADPDELYRGRETLANAVRAADLWAARPASDFAAAWKLARACYWLGAHAAPDSRRASLDRGVSAGERAALLEPRRPEGHFWLAANLGRLAESFGLLQALKHRGRIREELETVLAIDPAWQGGSADEALGEWYATVPRLFGGSRDKAEQHLRAALGHDPGNLTALAYVGELLIDEGRTAEARRYLQRVVDAPLDAEWGPEDREIKDKAASLLKRLEK